MSVYAALFTASPDYAKCGLVRYLIVQVENDLRKGRLGSALSKVQAAVASNEVKPACGLDVQLLYDFRTRLVEQLGWELWATRLTAQKVLLFPKALQPF